MRPHSFFLGIHKSDFLYSVYGHVRTYVTVHVKGLRQALNSSKQILDFQINAH
jgi:hypothetical protein